VKVLAKVLVKTVVKDFVVEIAAVTALWDAELSAKQIAVL
jgi:hypothetical protein